MADGTTTPNSWASVATLETVGKLATIVGILLPVTGALNRELAFILSGRVPLGVGSSLPVADLAIQGAFVMLPGLIGGVLFAWIFRRPFRFALPGVPKMDGWSRKRKVLLGLVYLALLGVLAYVAVQLLSYVFQASSRSASGLIGTVLAFAVIWWSARQPPSVEVVPATRLLPIVLAVVAVTAIGSSIGPTTAGTSLMNVAFESDFAIEGGTFSYLGEGDGATWLLSCDANAVPVNVRSSSILTMTPEPFGPSVPLRTMEETLRVGLGPGFVQRCP